MDWLEVRLPSLQLAFGLVQDIASFTSISEWLSDIAWDNRSVIQEVEKSATVLSEDDLLLGSLNGGGEVMVISLLQLLAGLRLLAFSLAS